MIPDKGGTMMKKTVVLSILVIWIVACAPPLRVYYFPGARHYPPTSPSRVDLLRHEPRRPHDAFAEIRMDPPARLSRFEVERRLIERAADIGADALIIEVDNIFRADVWVDPNRPYRGRPGRRDEVRDRIIVAIAIRYR
jgi:hypothetical protein